MTGATQLKVGDEVYFASIQGGKFGTIQALNVSFGVAVVNFGGDRVSVPIKDDLYLSNEIDRNALPLSSYEKMRIVQRGLFKPGAVIMCTQLGFGVVSEVLPDGTAYVDFKHFGKRRIETASFNCWAATDDDKDCQPRGMSAEPEPICTPEEITLAGLEAAVENWEQSVRSFEAEFDCDEEYTHDLFDRYCLHGVLNGFARQAQTAPVRLKARIEAADRRFIELTYEIEHDVWGGSSQYDRELFWYYYRWLGN